MNRDQARQTMLGRSLNNVFTADDYAEVERRLQTLEKRLDRLASKAGRATSEFSSAVGEATDQIGDVLVSALAEMAQRFRGGTRSVGDEAARMARRASKLGHGALDRVTTEVEQRPLLVVGVAVGVGLLLLAGLAARRHQ
jgi:ElaB/YqjD/DUF883 family membrane-anchored ribosome-binding protein